MFRILPVLLTALLPATTAFAQALPPDGALPLSEILIAIEESEPVRVVLEVDWDSDGYWEIEYVDTSDRDVEIRVDPATGAVLPRR
jgi:hypothetical protein